MLSLLLALGSTVAPAEECTYLPYLDLPSALTTDWPTDQPVLVGDASTADLVVAWIELDGEQVPHEAVDGHGRGMIPVGGWLPGRTYGLSLWGPEHVDHWLEIAEGPAPEPPIPSVRSVVVSEVEVQVHAGGCGVYDEGRELAIELGPLGSDPAAHLVVSDDRRVLTDRSLDRIDGALTAAQLGRTGPLRLGDPCLALAVVRTDGVRSATERWCPAESESRGCVVGGSGPGGAGWMALWLLAGLRRSRRAGSRSARGYRAAHRRA